MMGFVDDVRHEPERVCGVIRGMLFWDATTVKTLMLDLPYETFSVHDARTLYQGYFSLTTQRRFAEEVMTWFAEVCPDTVMATHTSHWSFLDEDAKIVALHWYVDSEDAAALLRLRWS